MPQYAAARINMVDSQIHTMGVVSEAVLDAFRTVPREKYVPDGRQSIAYCDEDLPVAPGRCLMEPVTHARLLQAALPVKTDTVLDLGCATGYSAAILSTLCGKIVAVEHDASLLVSAQKNWADAGFANIQAHQGALPEGYAPAAPYSLIVLNGTVAHIPEALVEQLAPEGRLVGVVRGAEDRIGHAVIISRNAQGIISTRTLFDAAVPYLPGLEPRTQFVF